MNFRMSEEQYQKHQEAVQRARRVEFGEPLPQLSEGVKPAGLVPTHLVTASPASQIVLVAMPDTKPSKYLNKPTWVEGVRFASKAEALKWIELRYAERVGTIKNLKRQVRYRLKIGAIEVTKYVSDFEYDDPSGRHHVVDVKGYKNSGAYRTFQIKQRLMKALLNIDVEEA